MKTILKLLGGFLIGTAIGLTGAYIILYFTKDMSLSVYLEKFTKISLLEMFGVPMLSLLFLTFSIFLQIILHEGGHLVCGLLTGYRFVSFRILNQTLIRQDGRLRIKRFNIGGTGGQCLLVPPERPIEEIPYKLYNAGGVLANLLTALLAILPLIFVDGMPKLLVLFLSMFAFAGICLGLLNGIPMRMNGIGNDADNMLLLKKNRQSKRALVMQLRINAQVQAGVRPCEMPATWFDWEEEIDYKDALQVNYRQMCIGYRIDKGEWEASYHALEAMAAHKDEIIGLLCNEILCELLFLAFVTGRSERAEELYTPQLLAHIKQYQKVMSSKQRLLCVLALYREKDPARAKEIYETLCRQQEKYLMQGEVRSDIALMKSVLTQEGVL